jgi:hypothetical protein
MPVLDMVKRSSVLKDVPLPRSNPKGCIHKEVGGWLLRTEKNIQSHILA